jgi:signal transduction histidine kinase/CheY-like chemotaxis protein
MQSVHAPAMESHVLSERVRLLYSHAPYILVGNFLAGLILVLAIRETGKELQAVVWLFAVGLVAFLRLKMVLGFSRHLSESSLVQRNAWSFAVFSGISGLLWGGAAFLFFDPQEPYRVMVLVILLAGMTSGSVASLSAFFPAYFLFALPVGGLLALRLFLQGGVFFAGLGFASLVYTLVNLFYARNMQRSFDDSIRLRLEKESLLETVLRQKEVAENARFEAESSDKAKSRFIAAASHDLRQPMQALLLLLDALYHDLRRSRHAGLVRRIQEAGNNMSSLLESLLDYSRIEAGIIPVKRRSFPLTQMLGRIESEYAPLAHGKGLKFTVVPTARWVESDPALLERLVGNLVDNAIKYTYKGGVAVGCRYGHKPRLEVWDTGIGIDQVHWKGIFEGFYQVQNPERNRAQGLGLGLAIVEGLAISLGHRIGLKSLLGRGSMFFVELEPGVPYAQKEPAPAEPPIGGMAGMRILVIDDDVREAFEVLLKRWGCEALLVSSEQEALDCLRRSPWIPDAILADYRLRGQDVGVESIRSIGAMLAQPVPAAILTGDTSPEQLKAIRAHGYPCLHKPVNGARLKAILSSILIEKSYNRYDK